MRQPDFFIVGAPKCGTTAMYEYLRQHPALFLPERKELYYFGEDLGVRRTRPSLDAYLANFQGARPDQLVGAAYVWYLYSETAAQEIKSFAPDAKILIMLRNPADAMFALHSEWLYNGNEDVLDFSEALAAEPERQLGQRVPPSAHLPRGLLYRRVFDYPDQLQRYLDAFGTEAVHVILFDDFVADTRAAYQVTLRFLGVDDRFAPSFPVVNPNKRARSSRIRDFLAQPPDSLRSAIRRVVPAQLRRSAYRRAVGWNTRPEHRPPMNAALRSDLRREMSGSVRRLEQMLGRELPAWRGP